MTFSINERRVIAERAYGWEKAKPAMLAKVFGVHPSTIHAELRRAHCMNCGAVLCACSDLHYAGLVPKTARVSHSTVGVPGDVPTSVSGDTIAQRGAEAPHDLKGQVADCFNVSHDLTDTQGAR